MLFVIPHFRVKEFAQKGHDYVLLDRVALMALNNFRQMIGMPITITSGYRTGKHNEEVGGVKNSLHLTGAGFDITFRKWSFKDLGWDSVLYAAGFTEIVLESDHWHVGVEHGK